MRSPIQVRAASTAQMVSQLAASSRIIPLVQAQPLHMRDTTARWSLVTITGANQASLVLGCAVQARLQIECRIRCTHARVYRNFVL